jgi:hypothetical protein
MDEKILAAIDQEIARLQQARVLLAGTNLKSSSASVRNKPKRTLSAKARKAIAEALGEGEEREIGQARNIGSCYQEQVMDGLREIAQSHAFPR